MLISYIPMTICNIIFASSQNLFPFFSGMDKQIYILAIFLFFHIYLSHFRLAKCDNATSICTHTPHPELCITLQTTLPHRTLDQNDVDLGHLSLMETLVQAANAHKLISEIDSSSFDELGRSAWDDCLELYQDTIHQLNRSIDSNIDAFDAQTWLSAAIANEQTCRNGFLDFNLSSHLESFKLMLGDFSKTLANSLAINKAIYSSFSKQKRNSDHFPDWVSARDRRLLRSPRGSVKADVVVAQDGSGDYTTISEGLAAATRRGGGGLRRFVIYVKNGVYRENVEIKKSMKNLMLIGDGIDATVVSGDRNVQDGFTTFRSATFGEIIISISSHFFLSFKPIILATSLYLQEVLLELKWFFLFIVSLIRG